MLVIYCLYGLVGVVAGILSGLLGIGGGVFTVPCLFFLFHWVGYSQDHIMHVAIGTSLASMVFSALSSTWAHNQRGAVLKNVVMRMIPGLLLGSLVGALIASSVSEVLLEVCFGVFLCLLGATLFRKRQPHAEGHRLPANPLLTLLSSAIGGISIILGIGGGTLSAPLLMFYRVPAKWAVGTSAGISLVVTVIGAISYLILGMRQAPLPETIGYINIPAFIILGIVTFLTAPYGARLAHMLSDHLLKRIFGALLILVGLSMLY